MVQLCTVDLGRSLAGPFPLTQELVGAVLASTRLGQRTWVLGRHHCRLEGQLIDVDHAAMTDWAKAPFSQPRPKHPACRVAATPISTGFYATS
jgi:hypothetical protein